MDSLFVLESVLGTLFLFLILPLFLFSETNILMFQFSDLSHKKMGFVWDKKYNYLD